MKKQNNKLSKWVLFALVISELLFVGLIIKLNALPSKYLYIGIALLLIYTLFAFLLIKKNVKGQPLWKGVAILVTIAMFFGSFYVYKTGGFLSNISNANSKDHVISFVAMKSKGYKTLKDVNNTEFGFNERDNLDYIKKAFDNVNGKHKEKFIATPVTSLHDVVTSLYDDTYEVIIINEAQRSFILDDSASFDEDTVVLHTEIIREKIDLEQKPVNVKSDTFSFYISGIDTYGPISTVSRTDVNMIMTVNPQKNQILLTGIPRDYHVPLVPSGGMDKLTHSGLDGVDNTLKTLENFMDIDIDYFIRVNFSSVKTIVDTLGGVTVVSRYNFNAGGFSFVEGENTIYGDQALAFVRERKSLPDGDVDRVKNQQALMAAIIKKAMSPSILTNYASVLSAVSGSFETSMPEREMTAFIKSQLDNPSSFDIANYVLKGSHSSTTNSYHMPGPRLYVAEPDMNSVACGTALIHAMERNESIPSNASEIDAYCNSR